jgi:hypothetical protein
MRLLRTCIGLSTATAAAALTLPPVVAQSLPTDAQPLCAIPPGQFAQMFESGSVTLNGVVKPADSTQNLDPPPLNCPFFTWSEQMFLWMTSPAPRRYGGGGRIMFSPSFFTVSPPIPSSDPNPENWRRNFIRNVPGAPIRMQLRTTELGPHLRPVVLSRTGQVIEVVRPVNGAGPRPVPIVRLRSGASVRLGDVRRAPSGALQFFDTRGRALQVRTPVLPRLPRTMVRMQDGTRVPLVQLSAVRDAVQARRFDFRGIPVFLDAANNVIDVEPGQADGGVLLSQGNALIYYIIVVNDVFAWHRTMQGPGLIPDPTPITFPLTAADVATVVNFAASHNATIVDPEALAIESKSSWVAASQVANPSDYIQVRATVPTFDTSNPNEWVANGEQTINLVMVGLHVVGSTLGHGEMVWATYEHFGNAPNAAYSYNSTSGPQPHIVPQNTAGSWLFTPNGSAGPFNAMNASWDVTTGHIAGSPVGPSAVLRMNPWGTSPLTNPTLNTQVISANVSRVNQLAAGDVRRQYFQLGTTWTIGGASPNGNNQVGTNRLANATIETFAQRTPPNSPGTNCFSCHGSNTVAVSHIYRQMNPLP